MAALAPRLARNITLVEPFQRRARPGLGASLAGHVADLAALCLAWPTPPALIAHSWGAMLALCLAAEIPSHVGPLALIGCGCFDPASRAALNQNLEARLPEGLKKDLAALSAAGPPGDQDLARLGRALMPFYSHDPLPDEHPPIRLDGQGHVQAWADMLARQAEGRYPAAFSAIKTPAAMFHGADDPHPGPLIHAALSRFMPGLEYFSFPFCGHYPWLERQARQPFFARLNAWLAAHLSR